MNVLRASTQEIASFSSTEDHTLSCIRGSFLEYWKLKRKAIANNVSVWSCPLIITNWQRVFKQLIKPTVWKQLVLTVVFQNAGHFWMYFKKGGEFHNPNILFGRFLNVFMQTAPSPHFLQIIYLFQVISWNYDCTCSKKGRTRLFMNISENNWQTYMRRIQK